MGTRQENLIAQYGAAYIRSLVAAEAAVRRGEFTAAKILRAAGYVQRTLAMRLMRLETTETDTATLLKTALSELRELEEVLPDADSETGEILGQMAESRGRAEALLRSGIESLETYGDMLDTYVPEMFWVCLPCGAVVTDVPSETCPVCGALRAEFAWLGPFYVETPERLGRMSPIQILAVLDRTPSEIVRLTADISESTLSHAPSAEQWGVKEIIGHLVETDRLFARRVALVLERDDVPDLAASGPPWRLHEGKGYQLLSVEELLALFQEARVSSLALVRDLTPAQWSRQGKLRDAATSLLDLGIWLANHDLGHTAQIRRLCDG